MDIVAHTLWVGAGLTLASRRAPVPPAVIGASLALAALPDLLHLVPLVVWWLVGDGNFAALRQYMAALPGHEPAMPPAVHLWSHHLHCLMHSAPVAGLATVLLWPLRRIVKLPLLAWWSHIVIDVFTHSAEFYPVPVLYPVTYRGFDGLAWNTPWFMVFNYAALTAVGVWLLRSRRARRS